MIFIINSALHVLGIFHPSSGAYELYVQQTNQQNCIYQL